MILVRCEVRPSRLHGVGLFALEDIKAGTMTWRQDDRIDIRFPFPMRSDYPKCVREHIEARSYKLNEEEFQRYPSDQAQFMNHSVNANCRYDAYQKADFAIRDIKAGQEITTNYYLYNMKYPPGHFEKEDKKP